MSSAGGELGIFEAQWRVLSFRFDGEDLSRLGGRHLAYGLLVTWGVGFGRYWDHPNPYPIQALGLGSLPVLLGLAVFLFLVLWPLRPKNWSFPNLLTFLSLTSLPAILYAIPVERFLSLHAARSANVWFLVCVALWRVALLGRYLTRRTDLTGGRLVPALLLPIALVIVTLTLLNLEQVIFNVMAGIREDEGSANDTAYGWLFFISTASFFVSPLLLIAYGFSVWARWRERSAA